MRYFGFSLALFLVLLSPWATQAQTEGVSEILSVENRVETQAGAASAWLPARTNQLLQVGHRLQTGVNSRAAYRNLASRIVSRVDANTLLEILPPRQPGSKSTLNLKQGAIYFFGRDRPRQIDVTTPTVAGAIRGTEFNLSVEANGRTVLTMIEGEVELSNPQGTLVLSNGEQGTVDPGGAPVKTPVLMVMNIIQWALYYPAVLDLDELQLGAAEQQALAFSLAAYRAGDLLGALAAYPANRQPATPLEAAYLAQLLLAVGQVDQADVLLGALPPDSPFPNVLRRLVAVVKVQNLQDDFINPANANSASAWLAESYALQAKLRLAEALKAARRATQLSPNSGLARVRVAELEFSFGRLREMQTELDTALQLSPRNAQAAALKGFVLAGQNRVVSAWRQFDQAIALDGGLANGWLGRGLVKIRLGQVEAGLLDLQVAATVEPQRAVLRSYLGKAFSQARDPVRALHEIALAQDFDKQDPTAWLYSALIKQQNNRINEAVQDLEYSVSLNDNRSVYRSRLLLDQDRAVRGANLASVYEDAGMNDLSLREASRAVNADYANYSAHTFLANSYNNLRDPRQVNIRYETPWLTEYLVGNLLAPANAGTLSANVTQQEYGRLFERNRFGLVSSTEYTSQGAWAQSASQYGLFGNCAYAVDATWRAESGSRPNSDFEQTTVAAAFKQELGASDNLFLQGAYYNSDSGDVAQYYDNQSRFPRLRVREKQEPLLMLGYHHQWTPGSHTLFLGGRLQDSIARNNPDYQLMSQSRPAMDALPDALPLAQLPVASLTYRSDWTVYSAELQHLLSSARNTLVAGARFQYGCADIAEEIGNSTAVFYADNGWISPIPFALSAQQQQAEMSFQRAGIYAYEFWRILDPVQLSAGLSYDHLSYPLNFGMSPITTRRDTLDRWSPKAGIQWNLLTNTYLRAAYTRSLGGVVYDQSFRLEPVQVAGFNQAFRGLVPMALQGTGSGERMETYGVALDTKLATRTYLSLQAEQLKSRLDRLIGASDLVGFPTETTPSSAAQRLGYREQNLILTVNQLLERNWALGASYRLSRSTLNSQFPELAAFSRFPAVQDSEAILHQIYLFGLFNHRCGFFSRFDALWTQQSNRGYAPDIPGNDFWQLNAHAGYRFWQRRAELKLGVLNLTGQDYRLNPLNLTMELPHERTLMMSLKIAF